MSSISHQLLSSSGEYTIVLHSGIDGLSDSDMSENKPNNQIHNRDNKCDFHIQHHTVELNLSGAYSLVNEHTSSNTIFLLHEIHSTKAKSSSLHKIAVRLVAIISFIP